MSPATASLSGSGVQSFTAAVSNDSSNAGVTWSIGSGAGALSASTLTGVTYTAPSTIGATTTVTLTATSKTDTTKIASAAITLNPSAPPPTITSVAASCIPASVQTGQTSQCTAAVTGTGAYSSTVTWSVSGVQGGNSTVGTISAAGLYTAPSAVPSTNPVTVAATSTEDTTKSGSATITITAAPAPTITTVAASCNPTSVQTAKTSQCAATVTGTGSYSSTVTWSVGGVAGGNSTVGTISAAGLYTAPSAVPSTNPVTVKATSSEDTTKSGSATVTITAAPAPTITSVVPSCTPTSVQTGATSQCSAVVTGTGSFSTTVTWSVSGVLGGNSTVGTISTAGLYTAPSAVPATNPVTITATSSEDTTKSGTASVTVTASTATITSVAASCLSTSVQIGATSQCAATVTGTGSYSSTVTWAVGGVAGGNATLGTISTAGLYTAPAAVPATNPVTITATSTANTAKSGSATITITAATAAITSVVAACVPTSVETGTTSQCTATVTGTGSYSSTVTWSVGGVAGGNSTVGTISSAGVYTAPSTVPATNPVTVTATSTEDTTKSGSASVTVTAATSGGITISALSENSATPFDQLTVTGAGFSNGTLAISILFTPENGDPPLMIPVTSSTDTSLQLMVPAFFAKTTGAFSAETVDVQVVAFSSTTTYLSNTIKAIPVSALPAVTGGAPAGTMTAAALSATLNMSVNAQTLGAGNSALANISADLAQLDNDIYPLIDAINTITADPTQTVNLTAANGTTIVLTAQMLAQSDQYVQALLAATVSQASIPAATSTTSCPAATGNTAFDTNLCNVQVYMQALAALGPSPSLTSAPGLYPAWDDSRPMLTITKPDAEAMAFFANLTFGALAEACDPVGGAVIYGVGGAPMVTTFIMSLAEGGEVPSDTELAGEFGKGVLSVAADSGIPGISTAVELVQAFKDVVNYQPPQKGILLSSGIGTLLPDGITYLNPNTGAPTTLLKIPSAPAGATFDTTSLVVAPGTTYMLSLTTNGSGGGSITAFPSDSSFPVGTAVEVNEVANSISTFTGWGGACTGTGTCSVTMNSNQSVSATFTGGVTDWVTPSISLGSVGGCAGGSVSGAINVTAAPGVTWTAVNNFNVGQAVEVISPTSGTGSALVTLSITVPPQTVYPGGSCGFTYSNTYTDGVPFVFSDGTNQYTNVTWIYVLLD